VQSGKVFSWLPKMMSLVSLNNFRTGIDANGILNHIPDCTQQHGHSDDGFCEIVRVR
jgi:hypothetical protein